MTSIEMQRPRTTIRAQNLGARASRGPNLRTSASWPLAAILPPAVLEAGERYEVAKGKLRRSYLRGLRRASYAVLFNLTLNEERDGERPGFLRRLFEQHPGLEQQAKATALQAIEPHVGGTTEIEHAALLLEGRAFVDACFVGILKLDDEGTF